MALDCNLRYVIFREISKNVRLKFGFNRKLFPRTNCSSFLQATNCIMQAMPMEQDFSHFIDNPERANAIPNDISGKYVKNARKHAQKHTYKKLAKKCRFCDIFKIFWPVKTKYSR